MANNVEYVLSLKDLLTAKLNDANVAANRLEGTMSGVQSLLGALGVAGGIAGVIAFGKSVVDAGTKVEDARVGLTTLLKDANEAGQVIQNTMTDAARTPFEFEGLLAANQALIAAGLDSKTARTDVLNLANAVAASGKGNAELERMVFNLQQIKTLGKASAMDIRQFGMAGINIYAALDAAGIKYGKDSAVTYEQIAQALKVASEEGGIYYHGLENMAGNTSIRLSNLKDDVFNLSVKMFDNLKPAIDGVASALDSSIKFISNHGKEIKALMVGVSVGAGVWGAYTLAVNGAKLATELMTIAEIALNAAMNANPIMLVATAIGAVSAAIYYAYQKSETFRNGIRLLADDAMIAGNALKLMWYAATGNAEGYQNALTRINALQKERKEILAGTFHEAKEGVSSALPAVAKSGKTTDKKEATETVKSVSPKGATANKAVTINISIGKMIETFKISTTNLTESTTKVHEAVSNVLLQAINDSQIVGNI